MALFPRGAPRGFCVTVEGETVRYRVADERHEDACDGAGEEASAASVLAALDAAVRWREVAPWIPFAALFAVFFASLGALAARFAPLGIVAVFAGTLAVMGCAFVVARRLDRERGTLRLVYHLDGRASARYARLQRGLRRLAACKRVWHVPTEGRPASGKHKFGAKLYLRRYRIRATLARPVRVLSNVHTPTLYGEHRKFFFFPDRALVFDERGVRALSFASLGMHAGEALCVEDEDVPSDARVVDSTWLHAKADGSPDPAYANNRRFPIVLYGELEFAGPGGVRELFQFSQPEAADEFLAAVEAIAWGDEEEADEPDAPGEADPAPEEEPAAEEADARDELFDEALRAVVRAGYATLDLLAAEFGIAYGRAARILDLMEQEGYVGPAFRNRPRTVNRSAVRLVDLLFADDAEAKRKRASEGESARRRQRRRARGPNGAEPPRLAHDVLGVASTATREQVTAAYHELAQMYHPDKVASLAPEFRELAERRMKEINAAYRAMIKRGPGAEASGPER